MFCFAEEENLQGQEKRDNWKSIVLQQIIEQPLNINMNIVNLLLQWPINVANNYLWHVSTAVAETKDPFVFSLSNTRLDC